MTFLGKLFVMINAGFSLVLAFWALGLYFTGIDWGYDVAEPGKKGGLIDEKQKEINALRKEQVGAAGGWKAARPPLWKAEEDRRKARAYYVKELEWARGRFYEKDGKVIFGPDNNPYLFGAQPPEGLRKVVDPAGKPVLGKDLKAMMVEVGPARGVPMETVKDKKRGDFQRAEKQKGNEHLPERFDAKVRGDKEDLYSRIYYQLEMAKTSKENRDLLEQLKEQHEKDAELSRQIHDEQAKPPTGLQIDLVNERVKREGVQATRRQIRPLYVNTAVESELSVKRLEQLQAQIKQLKAYCVKRGIDVQVAKQ